MARIKAERAAAVEKAKAAALRTFTNAMRRHERRARAMGLTRTMRRDLRSIRLAVGASSDAESWARGNPAWYGPRSRFLMMRALDAVARLRADLAALET